VIRKLFYKLTRPEIQCTKVYQFGREWKDWKIKNKTIRLSGSNLICYFSNLNDYTIILTGNFNHISIGNKCTLHIKGGWNTITGFDGNTINAEDNNIINIGAYNNLSIKSSNIVTTGTECEVSCMFYNVLDLGNSNHLKTPYLNYITNLGENSRLDISSRMYLLDKYSDFDTNNDKSIINFRKLFNTFEAKDADQLLKLFDEHDLLAIYPLLHPHVQQKLDMMEILKK
jgi:hypothetical protein